jgi:hypothetical protein
MQLGSFTGARILAHELRFRYNRARIDRSGSRLAPERRDA